MLRKPDSLNSSAAYSLALAIQRIPENRKQKHVALLYRAEDDSWRLLHLGWHHVLRHEQWDGAYSWVPFENLAPEVTEGLADLAVIIGTRDANRQIPYSVVFTGGQYFDESGIYIRHRAGEGLTCATFLLAVFRRWGLSLIDESTWPQARRDDASWALNIVRVLYRWCKRQNLGVPLEHFVEQLRQRWSLRRFRPEEVCACAGLFEGVPLAFSVVDPLARQILRDLP